LGLSILDAASLRAGVVHFFLSMVRSSTAVDKGAAFSGSTDSMRESAHLAARLVLEPLTAERIVRELRAARTDRSAAVHRSVHISLTHRE
jgi:hypothetical protein